VWGRTDCWVGVPERESIVDKTVGVNESGMMGSYKVGGFVLGVIYVGV